VVHRARRHNNAHPNEKKRGAAAEGRRPPWFSSLTSFCTSLHERHNNSGAVLNPTKGWRRPKAAAAFDIFAYGILVIPTWAAQQLNGGFLSPLNYCAAWPCRPHPKLLWSAPLPASECMCSSTCIPRIWFRISRRRYRNTRRGIPSKGCFRLGILLSHARTHNRPPYIYIYIYIYCSCDLSAVWSLGLYQQFEHRSISPKWNLTFVSFEVPMKSIVVSIFAWWRFGSSTQCEYVQIRGLMCPLTREFELGLIRCRLGAWLGALCAH